MTTSSALIDIGGSSVKVVIRISNSQNTYTHEISTAPQITKTHIYFEPDQLFATVIDAMNACANKLPRSAKIGQVYISTLRQGFCLIRNSREITPLFLNSDISGKDAKTEIQRYGSSRIYEETGHWFAPQLTLPKLISLKRAKPEFIDKNSKLLFVHDWLVWKLTRSIITEMTLVSAGQFANLAERSIHSELLNFFELPASLFPETVKFGSSIGMFDSRILAKLNSRWSMTKVIVGGGDSHFLHMGTSGNRTGKVVISAGSSTPITLLDSKLGKSQDLKPWKSTSFTETNYLLEGNVGYPGSFYSWLKRSTIGPIIQNRINIENISKAPTVFGSCNFWNEDKWDSRPAFSILGDFSKSSISELALGLTLDYSYALSHQISAMISDGFDIDQVFLTGGGANQQIQSILESLLDLPVDLVTSEIAVSNLFSILNGESVENFDLRTSLNELDEETSEFLKHHAMKHALLYEQVEGTRKVLEHVS